jgi:hypothetical protein
VNETCDADHDPVSFLPQQRTLLSWAMKFFDSWVQSKKDADTVSVLEKIKPRGWKEGTIIRFFELKDEIYLAKVSSRVQQQGEN